MFEQWADFVSKIWPLCSMWEPIFVHKSDFFTLHPYNPIFLWAQTDSTQWDHNFPITGGNFGYLWFSGRYSFGCLAGCFRALIAQKSPFLGQKCCFFLDRSQFFEDIKMTIFLWWPCCRVGSCGAPGPIFGPKRGKNLIFQRYTSFMANFGHFGPQ